MRIRELGVAALSLGLVVAGGCGGGQPSMPGSDGGVDADPELDAEPDGDAGPTGLKGGAPVAYTAIYDAPAITDPGRDLERPWIPVDVAESHDGALWVVQTMNRLDGFEDAEECTTAGSSSADPADDDCFGLQGSTATIADPAASEPATVENGRVRIVVDANAWHFMRRPSALAFGPAELRIEPGDPGTLDEDGEPLITEPQVYENIFATCPEHVTANHTDDPPFIGPTLWTGDPDIYSADPPEPWSNGAHLDMVHATQYCMGIAWERDSVFWTFNGEHGVLDRYDFGVPHLPGHFFHDDAEVRRYFFDDQDLARVKDVPSNMAIDAGELYLSDTGNRRVIAVGLGTDASPFGTFRTFEGLEAHAYANPALREVVTADTASSLWGGTPQPSGLAVLDEQALVVADHASGRISIVSRSTGEEIRTLDTGLGTGIGGLTVIDGVVYFAHLTERRVFRIDVQAR